MDHIITIQIRYKYNISYICVSKKRDRQGRYNTSAARAGLLKKLQMKFYTIKEASCWGDNDSPNRITVSNLLILMFSLIFFHFSFILFFSGQDRIYHVDEGSAEVIFHLGFLYIFIMDIIDISPSFTSGYLLVGGTLKNRTKSLQHLSCLVSCLPPEDEEYQSLF